MIDKFHPGILQTGDMWFPTRSKSAKCKTHYKKIKMFQITRTLLKFHLLVATPLSVQPEHKYDYARKGRSNRTASVLLFCTVLSAWHKSAPPS